MPEFAKAIKNAGRKVVGICFHDGSTAVEKSWASLKPEYTNVHLYKVNTLNSLDIRDRYADSSVKPYFKFYKDGVLVSEVKYGPSWVK